MKTAILVALSLVLAGPAAARPNSSQHPRVGHLAELTFAPGSAKLSISADSKEAEALGEIAAWAEENRDGLIVVDGHADHDGPRASNVKLSLERAKTVRNELVIAGVDPDQIVLAAFGEDGPQRPQNRRVVVWGTRAGMKAVIARTQARGKAVISTGFMSEADQHPQPGAVAGR